MDKFLLVVLRQLLEAYFRRLRVVVLRKDQENKGREILGAVAGREAAEDVAVGIDTIAERLFLEVLQIFQQRYPALQETRIVSEHAPQGLGSGHPTILCYIDPFDGSDEYLKGIESSWYSAITFLLADGSPLAAGMLDILAGKIFLIGQDTKETTILDLGSEQEAFGTPDKRTKVPTGEPAVIATYMGRSKYLRPLVDMLGPLLPIEEERRKRYKQLTWHGKGGSFIYAWIAAGKLIGYIMPNEPVSEILPGLGFALLAGFPVLVMEEDGTWGPFNLATHARQERVRALVVACTTGMAQDFVRFTASP